MKTLNVVIDNFIKGKNLDYFNLIYLLDKLDAYLFWWFCNFLYKPIDFTTKQRMSYLGSYFSKRMQRYWSGRKMFEDCTLKKNSFIIFMFKPIKSLLSWLPKYALKDSWKKGMIKYGKRAVNVKMRHVMVPTTNNSNSSKNNPQEYHL